MNLAQMNNYFGFVGLGQCGMRICQQFQKTGFSCSYINSDEVDTRGLVLEDETTLLLLKGTGTGKSLKVGAQILEENKGKFERFLSRNSKFGMIVFVAGAGGGTGGSFIAPAVEYAKSLGHKVGVILTLPPRMLGIVTANNSLRTLQTLLKQKIDLFILADNEYLLDSVGKDDTWWGKINERIVSNFHSIVEITRPDKNTRSGIGSIDQGEVARIITYGKGLVDIRKLYLTMSACSQPPEELQKLLFKPELVEGYDYKNTLCYLVCVDIPSDGSFIEVAKTIFDVSKKKLGNGVSILGMFTDPLLRDSVRVTHIQAGLKLPKILQSRIKNLKRDEKSFVDKQNKEDATAKVFDTLELDNTLVEGGFEGM